MNTHKITNVANGSAATDVAAFGQIPTVGAAGSGASNALSANDPTTTNSRVPSGSAGGDLSGTFPNPTVLRVNGIILPGSAPTSSGQVLTTTTTSTTAWQTPAAGVTIDSTSGDIASLGTQAAGSIGKAADSGHVHPMPRLDQVSNPTAAVSLNSQKITNLQNGSNPQDGAAFGQIPTSLPPNGTAGGDLSGTYPNPALSSSTNVESIISANSTVAGALQKSNNLSELTSTASTARTNLGLGNAATATIGTSSGNVMPGNQAAGGDLSGTLPNPTVAKINGVAVSGTPSDGQLLMATSSSAASWQTGSYVATAAGPSGDSSGATDASAINNAITAANTAGGGQVILRAGTYLINTPVIIQPNVSIIGAGRGTTIIELANGANCDVLQSVNFNTLTQTGAATFGSSGAYMFELRGLTVDGNRANQTSTGFGIRIYGYSWIMRDLEIRNAYNDGVYTEWGSPSGSPDVLFFECRAYNVSVHDNGANGWHHCGPTDCQFSDIIIYDNNASGGPCSIGFWNDADNASNGSGTHHFSSAALQLINGHIWGGAHTWGIIADGSLIASNCEIGSVNGPITLPKWGAVDRWRDLLS